MNTLVDTIALRTHLYDMKAGLDVRLEDHYFNGVFLGCSGMVIDHINQQFVHIDAVTNNGSTKELAEYKNTRSIKDRIGKKRRTVEYDAELLAEAVVKLFNNGDKS